MGVHVDLEVHLLLEVLATIWTQERSEVGVSPHMSVQVGRSVKGLLADHTYVWFDGCVGKTVAGEVPRLPEGSATHLTFEWLLTCMNSLQKEKKVFRYSLLLEVALELTT